MNFLTLKNRRIAMLFAVLLLLGLCGCGEKEKNTLNIAQQFGIAYAPLNIMEQLGMLEEKLPDVEINWKQFGGPTAIREAMLAGEVDFGFMGIAPVMIGYDNGMQWRYATGISANQVALVTDKEGVKSLKDFTAQDRIAILSPGCTQHILLCMLCKQQLGDYMAMDNQLVSMSHPDAMNALMSNTEVSAHFATPPYLQEELKNGMHIIADGEDIAGAQFTFISGVAMEKFYEEEPELYAAFIETLNEAIAYINENTEEAIRILAPLYGISEAELKEQMSYGGTIYSSDLCGVEPIKEAMHDMGFLKENYDYKDLCFENVIWKEEYKAEK
ncbi:MAG: ABC transporter substrate-binding protein [Lachnospiraceae bacterium]|nr:ABC transporter substrate-binding protein [Lachnospiraceae bacterium]